MNSQFGSYIHYHKESYMTHGITRKNGKSADPVEYFEQHISAFTKTINDKAKERVISKNAAETFEAVYKSILNPNLEGDSQMRKVYEESHNIATQHLIDSITDAAITGISSSGKAIFNNGDANMNNDLTAIRQEIKNKGLQIKKQIDIDRNTKATTIIDRIENLLSIMSHINLSANNIGVQIENETKILYTDIQNLLQTTESLLDGRNYSHLKKDIRTKLMKIITNDQSTTEKDTLITSINSIYNLFKSPAIAAAHGRIGEDVGELAAYICKYKIGATTDNLIAGIKGYQFKEVGKQHYKTETYKASNVLNLNATSLQASDGAITVTYGEQKVDLEITDPDTGKDIGVSVKNYNLSGNSWITILNGMPLSTMLLNTSEEFAAHYLNARAAVFSCHTSEHNKRHHSKESIDANRALIEQANEALRLSALVVALKGIKNQSQAQLFLINDNSKSSANSVKLYSMNELIAFYVNESNSISFKLDKEGSYATFRNRTLPKEILKWNSFQYKDTTLDIADREGANARINQIWEYIHSDKIHMALNPFSMRKKMYNDPFAS